MIRVALVDDQALVRAGLRLLLERDGTISVVGEADNGRSGVQLAQRTRPDVVLMDIRMPVLDGLEATRQILAAPELSGTQVVVLTTFDEDDQIQAAIRAGAAGYLLKDLSPEELRHAVQVVARGDALLAPSITRRVMQHLATTAGATNPGLLRTLTEREREILRHVGMGESNDEIAASLVISPATARTYVSRLLAKLGARDRSQLVIIAYESGLILPGQP